jgi:aspartate-semialdehyde dehydrogenase
MKLAVVGVTGLVGTELLELLDEGYFPECESIVPIASGDSVGKTVRCLGRDWRVKPLEIESFEGADAASFSVGDALSEKWIPVLLDSFPEIKIVDKSNAFRLKDSVPLIVAGVNDNALAGSVRLAANPNCTSIQLALTLKPLFDNFGLARVIVSTYQSVSGAGKAAVQQLREESVLFNAHHREEALSDIGFLHNVLPKIGSLNEAGFASEEWKIELETRKILGASSLPICATAARVDSFAGHSISVFAALEKAAEISAVEGAFKSSKYIEYYPNVSGSIPAPVSASRPGYDLVQIGRLRRADDAGREYAFFCCANNLRIGAALNALRISRMMLGAGGSELETRND